MKIVPITLRAANYWVSQLHRHHGPSRGHKFSVAAESSPGKLVGVGIAGRPVSRMLDDGKTLEITRVATDGTPNACSMIYGALRAAAKALGYSRVITYTLEAEDGSSLRGAGFVRAASVRGEEWGRKNRPRENVSPTCAKTRWEVRFS